MRARFVNQAVLATLLIWQFSICLSTGNPKSNKSSKYLDSVREFADNVLTYGRDTYGPKYTSLFVDGLNSRIPLWYAQYEGHTKVVKLLLKHGTEE